MKAHILVLTLLATISVYGVDSEYEEKPAETVEQEGEVTTVDSQSYSFQLNSHTEDGKLYLNGEEVESDWIAGLIGAGFITVVLIVFALAGVTVLGMTLLGVSVLVLPLVLIFGALAALLGVPLAAPFMLGVVLVYFIVKYLRKKSEIKPADLRSQK